MAIKRSPILEGRITSISPAFTTKNGTSVWPPSINTSPRVIGRITPWEAIRAICAELTVGNMSAAFGALERSVDRVGPVNTSGALDRLCQRNLDAPNFTIDGHAVGLERILGRAPQHRARPHVELGAVQGARHRRAVERAFRQWTLPVRTHRLRGAETSLDVEDRAIPDQQHRSRRYFADTEFVLLELCVPGLTACGCRLNVRIRNRVCGETEPVVEPNLAELGFVAGEE